MKCWIDDIDQSKTISTPIGSLFQKINFMALEANGQDDTRQCEGQGDNGENNMKKETPRGISVRELR